VILGVGLDVVGVAGFAEQLDDPASGLVEATFRPAELRTVSPDPERRAWHLAGLFAAKEAFVKAWSASRRGRPPQLASVDLREIEVVDDGFGRPGLRLHGEVRQALAAPEPPTVHVSISHDGGVAAATVILES
jgi:holo-[acyl-carrier protein] synthase